MHQVTGNLTVSTKGALTINPGSALSYATLTQDGGTINGTLQNLGNFVYQSGLFNGRLVNQGAVNLGTSFTAAGGVNNITSMSINSGQPLLKRYRRVDLAFVIRFHPMQLRAAAKGGVHRGILKNGWYSDTSRNTDEITGRGWALTLNEAT
jgi:hypothetical protein